jgi:exodeoxyribonuclease VII small subunit
VSAAPARPDDARPFEELQRELDEIVGRLERGDVAVDEAVRLWRRGEELLRLCLARLETAQGSVEELSAGSQRAQVGRPATGSVDYPT